MHQLKSTEVSYSLAMAPQEEHHGFGSYEVDHHLKRQSPGNEFTKFG
jgi:hypothetical protein